MKVQIVKRRLVNKLNGRIDKIVDVGAKVNFQPYIYIYSFPLNADILEDKFEGSFEIESRIKINFKKFNSSEKIK
jgi:sensor domain CHASE-containing protein